MQGAAGETAGLEETREGPGGDLLHGRSQEETIVQRVEFLGFREFVGRADEAEQRDFDPFVAVVEEPLVQDGEEGVEDGGVGLEDLVDERHGGGGEVAVRLPDVLVVLETAHGQGAEELLRNGEPGEQALEERRAAAHRAEPAPELGLGGAGRTEQE